MIDGRNYRFINVFSLIIVIFFFGFLECRRQLFARWNENCSVKIWKITRFLSNKHLISCLYAYIAHAYGLATAIAVVDLI